MKLSVAIITYNHEEFIEQTLKGIFNQKVNFDFEVIIGEDNSTDSTAAIIEKYKALYPSKIFVKYRKSNIGMMSNFIDVLETCKGKYIASIEGDDYWVSDYKLQKQVDFLEANQEYVITWTDFKITKNGTILNNDFCYNLDVVTIDYTNLFTPYSTYTLTAVYKKEALDIAVLKKLKHSKDNSLYIMLLQKGKGAFLNFVGAHYRIHQGGVYSLKSEFFKKYSSYLNLKEITQVIPESQTKNINKIIKSLANGAAFAALKSKYTGEKLSSVQNEFMTTHFKKAPFKTKCKYYKRIFKYKFLK